MAITAILNCYRRPQNLKEQIEAVRSQSVPPDAVWLWVNSHPDNQSFDASGLNLDVVVWSSHNFKCHGRFSLGLLATTPYLAFFDDDTIPGKDWFRNCLDSIYCLESIGRRDPILGSAGVILNSRTYEDHIRVGWPSMNPVITPVDLVGHAWFLQPIHLRNLWANPPISFENGEDIQLSFFAQKDSHIGTYCPPHPVDNKELWGSTRAIELGVDKVAMSTGITIPHHVFFAQRDYVVGKAIDMGWRTIRNVI